MRRYWWTRPVSKRTKLPRDKKTPPHRSNRPLTGGSFTTKLHTVVDALGNGLCLVLTPEQHADSPQLLGLLAIFPTAPETVVADRAYDTNAVLAAVTQASDFTQNIAQAAAGLRHKHLR